VVSEFVVQDETGIIFLDYSQPLNILNFLFGLLRAGKFINTEVDVRGWYRRSPTPYIEVREIRRGDQSSTCYTYNAKLVIAFVVTALGLRGMLSPRLPALIFDFLLGLL
jgi:hypothetical protein